MPEEKTFKFDTMKCVKVKCGPYEEFFAPVDDGENVGPFTSMCDELEALPINDGLRNAERIIEDLIGDGVRPKRLKKVMECLGRTERAIDELHEHVNAIRLREYQKRYGKLPRSI